MKHGLGKKMAAWAGLLAVALNVFWPLIADGKAPGPHAHHHAVQAAGHDGQSGPVQKLPNDGHGDPHCAFCTLVGDKAPVVFPTGAWNTGVLSVDLPAFPRDAAAPQSAHQYPPAQPRAPPFFS